MWPDFQFGNSIPGEIPLSTYYLSSFGDDTLQPYSALDVQITQKFGELLMATVETESQVEYIDNVFVVNPTHFRENDDGYLVVDGYTRPTMVFVSREEAVTWVKSSIRSYIDNSIDQLYEYFDSENLPSLLIDFVDDSQSIMETSFRRFDLWQKEALTTAFYEMEFLFSITELRIDG